MENMSGKGTRRRVSLRAERAGEDSRYLDAEMNEAGGLRIIGQDLGPATRPVSSGGEYEWETVVPAEDLPALLRALDAPPDAGILDELAARWTGAASYDLERRIRDSAIPVRLWTHGG